MRRRILFFIFIFATLLWISNFFAEKYNLYFLTNWFDTISHTLGGIVVASVFIYTAMLRNSLPKRANVFLFAFGIGVVWECYELYMNLTHIADKGYLLDTAFDLFFDLFGAYIACIFVYKKSYAK